MTRPSPVTTRAMIAPVCARVLEGGGVAMARHVLSAARCVAPTQGWASLSTALQGRAIRLLAHLACSWATAPLEPPLKETTHGLVPHDHQNSPRPS
jgi:hypothetical protein